MPDNRRWIVEFDGWQHIVRDHATGKFICSIGNGVGDEHDAELIAASPMMLEALTLLVQLIGDEDLPDNGELSGAVICDLVRSLVKELNNG